MIRKILIVIGSIIILTLLLAWGYLLLLGTPKSVQEVFSEFGLQNGGTEIIPEQNIETNTTLASNNNQLVQLSTKATAGFVYIKGELNASGTPATLGHLRYAERGTGHIYDIDLSNNTETKPVATTVGQTVDAIFSPNGESVVLVSEKTDNISATAYLLGSNTTKTIELPDNSENVFFTSTSTVRYSLRDNVSTVAYQTNLLNESTTQLWSIAFTDVNIFWTDRGAYIINKIAPYLKSGIYLMGQGGLEKVVSPQYELSALVDKSGKNILYAAFDSTRGQVVGHILNTETSNDQLTTLFAVPEKCSLVRDTFWCASSFTLSDGSRGRLSEWYRGELSSSDTLWKQAEGGASNHIDYLAELAGFDIDVTDLVAAPEIGKLFFRNKINDTLWVYTMSE